MINMEYMNRAQSVKYVDLGHGVGTEYAGLVIVVPAFLVPLRWSVAIHHIIARNYVLGVTVMIKLLGIHRKY